MDPIVRYIHRTCGVTLAALSSFLAIQLLFASTAVAADAAAVWFSDHRLVNRVDPQTNTVIRSVPLPKKANALAIDPHDGNLLVLLNKTILRLSAEGDVISRYDFTRDAPWIHKANDLSLNPHDRTFWVVGQKGLIRIGSEGEKLAEWRTDERVRDIAYGSDDSLWVLTMRAAVNLTPDGVVRENVNLENYADRPIVASVDVIGEVLWIASTRKLLRFDLARINEPPSLVSLEGSSCDECKTEKQKQRDKKHAGNAHHRNIVDIDVHPISGALWVLSSDEIQRFSRDGSFIGVEKIAFKDVGRTKSFSFDFPTQSLWLVATKAVGRLTESGVLLKRFDIRKKSGAIGVAPLRVVPSVSILSPMNGVSSRDSIVPFRLKPGAHCGGVSCSAGSTYLSTLEYDARLNGEQFGKIFRVSGNEAIAEKRALEGENIFSVSATDSFGRESGRVENRFIVDTMPPSFISISPADGSVNPSQSAAIRGEIDDPLGMVRLLNSAGDSVGNSGGSSFSFKVTLESGLNRFSLIAQDRAGNEIMEVINIAYQPSEVVVTFPTPGSTVDSNATALCGAFQGPPNTGIVVNGRRAMVKANKFCVNDIYLTPGENVLSIAVTHPDGTTIFDSANVFSSVASSVHVWTFPESGIAPFHAKFSVANLERVEITQVVADFDGDGITDVTSDSIEALEYTYTEPGMYRADISISDSTGAVTTVNVMINVVAANEVDALLRGVYVDMLSQLRSGNVEGALNAVTGDLREKYRGVFNSLQDDLPAVAEQIGSIEAGVVGNDMAEYVVIRGEQAFLVYFVLCEDGVWRIGGM